MSNTSLLVQSVQPVVPDKYEMKQRRYEDAPARLKARSEMWFVRGEFVMWPSVGVQQQRSKKIMRFVVFIRRVFKSRRTGLSATLSNESAADFLVS
jgi:hypothetical protein